MSNPKISLIIIYSDSENVVKDIVESLKRQKFTDYEAVFVNCCAKEQVINLVSDLVNSNEKWNIITLPNNNSYEIAKQSAFGIASGDYVCFVDIDKKIDSDFLQNIYSEYLSSELKSIQTEQNKLYKRSYIENNSEINEIIKLKVISESQKIYNELDSYKTFVQEQLLNCYKNSDELINSKNYNLEERINNLEKIVNEKEKIFNENIIKAIENAKQNTNQEIVKCNNFIRQQKEEKDIEKQQIISLINTNNQYVEQKLEKIKEEFSSEISLIHNKLNEISEEQQRQYNNILSIINENKKETYFKLDALDIMFDKNNNDKIQKISDLLCLEDNMKKNFDTIYSYIDENNKRFYDELTALYKETDEKIRKNN